MIHHLVCDGPNRFAPGCTVRSVDYNDETDAYLISTVDRRGVLIEIQYDGVAFRRRFPAGQFGYGYGSGRGIHPLQPGEWWVGSKTARPSKR
ncbi:MAG: hypothetical protein ACRDIY_02650 [Chloroflexota bacterium]